jgi:tRNA pseudouridine38-40 synthase
MRTYEYLLPARVLDLEVDEAGEEAEARRMKRLEEFSAALRAFEGSHPFHNYTKRSQYTRKAKSTFTPKPRDGRGRLAWSGQEGAVMDDSSEEGESDDEDENEVEDDSNAYDADTDARFPKHIGRRDKGTYWLFETDYNDRIGQSHFRKIHHFTAGNDVERMEYTRADGTKIMSEPFVRVSVRGESFMLYQIRKMIATAAAASLGYVPLEFIPATLTRPCRAAMPLAPALTLYLHDVEFMDFRKNNDPSQPNRLERLEPSLLVREELSRFQREKLEPALAPALESEEWDAFRENLKTGNITPELSREIYKNDREEARAAQDALDATTAETLAASE